MEPLVNVNEAAKLLGLSSWTVRKLIAGRRLRAVRINRRVLLQPEELRRLIQDGTSNRNSRPGPCESPTDDV
jgi:excisionase family DNA binding protein